DGVVEGLHLGHRTSQPLGEAFGFGGQTPRRKQFQVGEFGWQRRGHDPHTPAVLRWYSSTHDAVSLCRWRISTSWSHSRNSLTTPDSTIVWVASSVFASCSPYSLNDTAASSCAIRSLGVRGCGKYNVPSKMWVLNDVGQ